MSTITVHSPSPGFTGTVAGVAFVDGEAEVDRANRSALDYFRRHGYPVGGRRITVDVPEPVDPRTVEERTVIGTRLRDAAVDPAPTDFLPPTNAGEANPHGGEVVAPGLHATPPAPIVPGPVAADTDHQQTVETAVADAVLVENAPVGDVTTAAAKANDAKDAAPRSTATHRARGTATPGEGDGTSTSTDDDEAGPPAKSANKPDWVDYAVAQGMDRDEAEALTKGELVDRYGG